MHVHVLIWKCFPHYRALVKGIHRSLLDSLTNGPVMWNFDFSLTLCLTNCWPNTRLAGVMISMMLIWRHSIYWYLIIQHWSYSNNGKTGTRNTKTCSYYKTSTLHEERSFNGHTMDPFARDISLPTQKRFLILFLGVYHVPIQYFSARSIGLIKQKWPKVINMSPYGEYLINSVHHSTSLGIMTQLPHDDVIKRKPVISPHKGQWRGALMFSLICV